MSKLSRVIVFARLLSALGCLGLSALTLVLLGGPAMARHHHGENPSAVFSLGPTGLGIQDGYLLVATRLNNESLGKVFHVRVDSITLHHTGAVSPPLPLHVGEIDAGDDSVIQMRFMAAGLSQGSQYTLRMHGTYRPALKPHRRDERGRFEDEDGRFEDHDREFDISTTIVVPLPAPGNASVLNGQAPSATVTGAPFPPIPNPSDFDEANEGGPPVPTGSSHPVTPTPNGTAPNGQAPRFSALKSNALQLGEVASVAFAANNSLNLVSGGFNGQASTVAEPSGGVSGGGVVFVTANWTAAYSTDGVHFTQLNPTTIFPNDAVGYCCDQVVQYAPSIDRFIWLLQGNGYRIATARPADIVSSGGTAWTYWNLTPAFFGLTGGLDYPDLSLGNNYLYLSFDEVGTGLTVARISLTQLQAGGTITVEWTDPKNGGSAYGGHVMQDTGNGVFWAGHNSTSQMRIFSLPEGSTTYSWSDVNIGSWSNTGLSATTPDGNDFLTKLRDFPNNAAIGATRGPDGRLWFAWSAGTDNNFAQPHIEMVTLDPNNNYSLLQQVQIWNPSYAFAYPALATNTCTGEIGFSLEGGGSGNYENHLVGFWGDFLAYITTASNVGTTRYGDYVTIRQDPGFNGAYFDAFGYGLNAPGTGQTGPQTDIHFVQFGRPGACQINIQ